MNVFLWLWIPLGFWKLLKSLNLKFWEKITKSRNMELKNSLPERYVTILRKLSRFDFSLHGSDKLS